MLKLQPENIIVDVPDLNQFQIGDHVVVDANADYDRFEGVIIGIELRRMHGSNYLAPSITILHDGCITDEFKPIDCRKVDPPTPQTHVGGADLTNEQKEITLLKIIDAMGGATDSSEGRGSWINWFCSDEIHNVQEDTFNRCNDKGWLHTTHNSDWDTSTTTLTKAGRAALNAAAPDNAAEDAR